MNFQTSRSDCHEVTTPEEDFETVILGYRVKIQFEVQLEVTMNGSGFFELFLCTSYTRREITMASQNLFTHLITVEKGMRVTF